MKKIISYKLGQQYMDRDVDWMIEQQMHHDTDRHFQYPETCYVLRGENKDGRETSITDAYNSPREVHKAVESLMEEIASDYEKAWVASCVCEGEEHLDCEYEEMVFEAYPDGTGVFTKEDGSTVEVSLSRDNPPSSGMLQ